MRKRRRRVTWFPTLGTQWTADDEVEIHSAGFDFNVPTLGLESRPATGIFPITFDSPQAETSVAAADTPLVDIVGSEYLLKRLVGKLQIANAANIEAGSTGGGAKLVECGFFVGRAENAPNQGTPIGYVDATYFERYDNYSPGAARTIREPWIWRRTWILGIKDAFNSFQNTQPATTNFFVDERNFPSTNVEAASALDGPHFDAKSARRVGNDDRLFFAVTVTPWPLGTEPDVGSNISGHLDVRILGLLVKAHNRSTF